jgi:hypothetical protein
MAICSYYQVTRIAQAAGLIDADLRSGGRPIALFADKSKAKPVLCG